MAVKQRNAFKNLDPGSAYSDQYLFVATVQADYSLSASEHVILKNRWVSFYTWAANFLFATFGYLLSLLPKFFAHLESEASPAVAKGEWITLGIGLAAVIFFTLIGRFCPNERKKLLKAIDEHFAKAPKTRQRVRG